MSIACVHKCWGFDTGQRQVRIGHGWMQGPRAELYHGTATSMDKAQGQRAARASGEAEKEELPASIDCERGDGSASLERGYDQGGRRKRE